jgi:hypothetical protein
MMSAEVRMEEKTDKTSAAGHWRVRLFQKRASSGSM